MRMHPARDPLLGAVDGVVLPIFGLCGTGSHTRHVGPDERLGDGEGDILLPAETSIHNLLLQRRIGIVEDGRETDHGTGLESIAVATSLDTREFLVDNHFVEVVEFFGLDDSAKEGSALKVLAGTHSHCVEVGFAGRESITARSDWVAEVEGRNVRHHIQNRLTGPFTALFTRLRIGVHMLIDKLPDLYERRKNINTSRDFPSPRRNLPFCNA